jgi:hypothetical protein
LETIDTEQAVPRSRLRRLSRRAVAGLALSITAAIMAGGLLAPADALPPVGSEPIPPPPPPTTPPPPPPTTQPPTRPPTLPGTPRFSIQAVSFRAVDETGWDGCCGVDPSDEPFFVWSSTNTGTGAARTVRSAVFGDVDTGESFGFSPAICMVRDCVNGVTGPIGLNTVVMENDFGDPATVQSYVSSAVTAAHWVARIFGYEVPSTYDNEIIGWLTSWFGDDLVADRSVSWSNAELVAALPNVGSVFYETISYAGDDGHYTVTYKLTRRTDLPPVLLP